MSINEIAELGGEGILSTDDVVSFTDAQRRIIALMCDGGWHPATNIIAVSGQREGLRRLRYLRDKGYSVERRRNSARREFEYRLTSTQP